MKLLLDTHIFLWALSEPHRLTSTQRSEIEDPSNKVYLSSISVSELAIKASLGKLPLTFDPLEVAEQSGFSLLDFSAYDAMLLHQLPFHHRDPFDRMLITQSIAKGLTIATQDPLFEHYPCPILA